MIPILTQLDGIIMGATLSVGTKPHYVDVGAGVWTALLGTGKILTAVFDGVVLHNDVPIFREAGSTASNEVKVFDDHHNCIATELVELV